MHPTEHEGIIGVSRNHGKIQLARARVEHRIATLWRYDKGEANDAPFVYFGQEPMGSGSTKL